MMKRREFLAASVLPFVYSALNSDGESIAATSQAVRGGDPGLVEHCRRILLQNLLKADERLLIATSHQYDDDFILGLLIAGSDIGATGGHLAIIPAKGEEIWFSKEAGATRGLTPWHWDQYASADLLLVVSPEAGARVPRRPPYRSGLLPVMTSYEAKLGDHPYRTDFERINRVGSKTRWLKLGGSLEFQKKYFPTPERVALTLRAAELVHPAKELRVTSPSGSDFRARKVGRPAHAQYGIADLPGRWDNFAFACIVVGPEEYMAEGVVVLDPGDMIQFYPKSIAGKDMPVRDSVRITFAGGYVTKVEGGVDADRFRSVLESFGDKEAFGISHVGFGTHERAVLTEPGFCHHNKSGSILFSLGANHGHGLGGPELRYSGLGPTTRKASSHSHFAVYGQSFYCDGTQVVDKGRLLIT